MQIAAAGAEIHTRPRDPYFHLIDLEGFPMENWPRAALLALTHTESCGDRQRPYVMDYGRDI